MNRRLAIALVCAAALAGAGAAQAVGAGSSGDASAPTQLWEQFPLDPGGASASGQPSRSRPRPPPAAAPAGGVDPLVWIIGGVLLLGGPLVLLAARRVRVPALRAPRVATESGTLVPLAPAFRPARQREPEPEPVREPPPAIDPGRVLALLPPEPEPAPRAPDAVAGVYELVWYRSGERLTFGLQPTDGRAIAGARARSASFRWDEDDDPPPTLRDAQRAHGRLRSRLLRDGWVPAGRGDRWFSHRFRPPER